MRLKSGFTLVELAIVIVVIGLLVGGVIQGQELIKQANIRKSITDLRSYTTSVATFKAKYNQLPGDFSLSTSFFPNAIFANQNMNGNNNSIVEYGESVAFFTHMALAGVTKEAFLSAKPVNYMVSGYGETLPKIFSDKYWVSSGFQMADIILGYEFNFAPFQETWGKNPWFEVTKPEATNGNYANAEDCIFLISIDEKVDDGKPHTGSIKSINNSYGNTSNYFNLTCSADGSNPNLNNNYVIRTDGAQNGFGFTFTYFYE